MGRVLKVVLYGVVGLLLALTLSVASFAIAGRRLGTPVPAVSILRRPLVHVAPSHGPGTHEDRRPSPDSPTPPPSTHATPTDDVQRSPVTQSPGSDDSGGGSGDDSGSGSDDSDHDDD